MELVCILCNEIFDNAVAVGYCEACKEHFAAVADHISSRQRPAPNVIADGKFATAKDCPQSLLDPVTDKTICGVCGSDELEPGYGIGSGYGCGTYNFCFGCNTFLDFHEDRDE